ncbi:MAG TPA: hypothetical protein VGS57_16520 [Thermoanaerobaculia bacterium]|jgi:hypothetical protein|nr:hypothetical protein [Thermoanaerobaculia bacterium]
MARRNVVGECKLCGNVRSLCHSHIIPEWAHRTTYDDTHTALAIHAPTGRKRAVQVGIREHLLCRECEDRIERLETGYRRFWGRPDLFPEPLAAPYVEIHAVDYKITSKFLLSVLWRAHISSHRDLAGVELGPYGEHLRVLLLDDSAAPQSDTYPTYCYVLRDPLSAKLAKWIVLSPVRVRNDGTWNYEFALLGCAWKIFVSRTPPSLPVSCRLTEDGNLAAPVLNCTDFPAIAALLQRSRT